MSKNSKIAIVGGGLAGCECALTLARLGLESVIFERKPHSFSEAHQNSDLAELVCSNSLRSNEPTSGIGLLKQEMRELGSCFMATADKCAIAAGKALAVDRGLFSREITALVESSPAISLIREEISGLDDARLQDFSTVVVAAGPLASNSLASSLSLAAGAESLYFYDAIAPIVYGDSIDMSVAFKANRQSKGAKTFPEAERGGEGDYINCPLNKEQYQAFHAALLSGQVYSSHNAEKEIHFEGCMPIEALAARGERTLVFGSLKPVGLDDPRTGRWPYAVVQLRAENRNKTMFNLVGCQTKLLHKEQDRIFRMIPGLEKAEFVRYGSMHRNTYVNAPQVLDDELALRGNRRFRLAGQITGVEGYVESAACGLWLGLLLAAEAKGANLPPPPPESLLGGMLNHLKSSAKHFQPSNAHFGLLPELEGKVAKKNRKEIYSVRARTAFAAWLERARAAV